MTQLSAALLLMLAVPGDREQSTPTPRIEVYEFTANWCQNCQVMAPTMDRLERSGVRVRQIDVDKQRTLAGQFRINQIPALVLVVDGRAVAEMRGTASYGQVRDWYRRNTAKLSAASSNLTVRGQSPHTRQSPSRPPLNQLAVNDNAGRHRAQVERTPKAPAANAELTRRALLATVRLKIEDADGYSFGTGTIIDVGGNEALVLTCGHLFRESGGKGAITVDLNVPDARPVQGELIAWDAGKRDIAVLSIRPGVRVETVSIANTKSRVLRGHDVFSIGCSEGRPASVENSFVVSVNRYSGPANITVKGQPVNGRSGGGLFNSRGELIGVCRAADPTDNEGIYVGLPVVYQQLDQIGQTKIYRQREDRAPGTLLSSKSNDPILRQQSRSIPEARVAAAPRESATVPAERRAPVTSLANAVAPDEIIVIVRDANGRRKVMTIPRPSAALMDQIHQASGTTDPRTIARQRREEPMIIRAQDE